MRRFSRRFITSLSLCAGHQAEDIRQILGGDLLRVVEQTEKVSRELQAQ